MPELQQAPPKYLQIADHLRDRILRGDLRPGDEVPSERSLATEWSVARPTATKALDALRSQGLVGSRRGAGTFVLDHLHRRPRDRYERSRETGRIYPSNERAVIVAAGLVTASDEVVSILQLGSDRRALRRHRVTHRDDVPVEVSTSWYAASLAEAAPRLLERERILEGTVAYVEAVTGRRGRLARDRISARLASDAEASELALGPGQHGVLVTHHTVCEANGLPIEFTEAIYPPGRWAVEHEYPLST